MAAVAMALVGDRYASSTSSSTSSSSGSSSSLSSSSGDTSEEDSSSSWSSSSSSSTCTSSASSDLSPSKKKKKKRDADNKKRKNPKKKSKKSTAVIGKRKKRTKSSKSLVGRDQDDDNEVGSMLLLGAELLKEVEEASSATSTAAAATAILMDKSRPAEPLPLPIGHYVIHGGPQNRAVLLEHVMSSVPAAQWQAILPPVLKEMNSAELKQLCLQQLQQLSDSAILNIINGGGDQGPAGKAVCSETGEGERSKKKKSKKSKKKKSAKAKKGERLEPTQEDQVEDESSGKTLMELLELEMRARAIKALLKKEEEGQGDDEWPADLVASSFDAPLTTPVQHIHRPLKTGEDASFSDKHKQSGARHAAHQHRSSVDPVPPTHCAQQPLNARPSRRPASLHQQTDDCVDFHRRDRHSSAKHDREQMLNKMTRQPRHYRHRHHERSRSPVRRAEPSTGGAKTEDTKHAAKSPPSRAVRGAVKSERRDNARGAHEKCDGTVQVAAEEIEYEEDGIQEVDIELGSGSGYDSANSARL
ncbi:uncharacterized protein LOC130687331 isoform X2 [Daphnia carinata]|uniref:uncharacterized protein LOC130687331 isoform X2 n=1 Tax=Daphnia carinata TaxID=120202 RepID=UPI00257C388C|nr:uncharacterized protein LOC130687331 isoform X2 [Daphnia carinata]